VHNSKLQKRNDCTQKKSRHPHRRATSLLLGNGRKATQD
jgi:hypothetical protein